jgi:hypothetical protein
MRRLLMAARRLRGSGRGRTLGKLQGKGYGTFKDGKGARRMATKCRRFKFACPASHAIGPKWRNLRSTLRSVLRRARI